MDEYTVKEKDVEDAFIDFINTHNLGPETLILGRQVIFPFGRADVIGLRCGDPFIAEIKKGVIDAKAVTQAIGYATQLQLVLFGGLTHEQQKTLPYCTEVGIYLVGKTIEGLALRLAQVHGVTFIQYEITEDRLTFKFYQPDGEYFNNLFTLMQIDQWHPLTQKVIAYILDVLKSKYWQLKES